MVPTPPRATRAYSMWPFLLEHDRGRGEGELVGGAVAELEVVGSWRRGDGRAG